MGRERLAREPLALAAGAYRLTPLAEADAPAVLALFSDPAVVEWMDIEPLEDLEGAREIVGWAASQRAAGQGVRWAVRRDGELVGTCGYNAFDWDRGRRGEVAFDVARAWWGRRVMAEVLPVVLAFGFRDLGLRRVDAMVTAGNDPSCRLLERHGFTREGTLRDHAFWKGRFWDQLVYGRLADPAPAAAPMSAERSDGTVVRETTPADAPAVLDLYRSAAGGLARRADEMDLAYVEGFLGKAAVALSAWTPDGRLAGEIHAARIGPAQFDHVLSDLTVAVAPAWQGRGLGSRLFRALIERARAQGFERIELMAREGNAEAIRLYERLGFRIEGRFERRVRLPDGAVEADVAMGLLL